MQLRGSALENTPAPRGEKRVAAKQNVAAHVRDVPARVARHFDNRERCFNERRQRNGVAFNERVGHARDVFSGGAVNGYRPARGQRIDTACVIGVMMRNQNGRERKFPCLKKSDNGRAIARINHDALAVAH